MTPRLTFYGDDFTGSSAVMEVLSFAGVPTMLFMAPPSPDILARYPDLQAIGVAGIARTKEPAWMRTHLPPVLTALQRLGAPVAHYKVCSTFDSSPAVGSIGVATEIGAAICDARWIPLVVGAPAIRRFQAFGTLFAGAGSEIHRLDRHPVMSRHPVTPMHEADLGRHLSAQTNLPVGVVDLVSVKAGAADSRLRQCLSQGARIIAIDVVDDETLAEAGRLIWGDGRGPVFAVGSQGVEYALVAHWRALGLLDADHVPPTLQAVQQLFAVSGSCAATTADQIAHAQAHGFQIIDLDATTATDPAALEAEVQHIGAASLEALTQGRDVLVATARGPEDPAVARLTDATDRSGIPAQVVNARLGHALGALVAKVRRATGLARFVIAGGDTSGNALTALGAEALSVVAPLAPGAPLCRLHTAADPALDGAEVCLKGGQMGAVSIFTDAKGNPDT